MDSPTSAAGNHISGRHAPDRSYPDLTSFDFVPATVLADLLDADYCHWPE